MRVPLRQHAVAAVFLLTTTGAFTDPHRSVEQ